MLLDRIPSSGRSPAGHQSNQNVWVLPAISRDVFCTVVVQADSTCPMSALIETGGDERNKQFWKQEREKESKQLYVQSVSDSKVSTLNTYVNAAYLSISPLSSGCPTSSRTAALQNIFCIFTYRTLPDAQPLCPFFIQNYRFLYHGDQKISWWTSMQVAGSQLRNTPVKFRQER